MNRALRIPWKDLALIAPAVILLLAMAGAGLRSGLFPDEMMNIYGYWRQPWSKLLVSNLLFYEGGYRPAGAFFYRPLFDLAGFNPLPYRLVCFALLLTNLVLAYCLVRRLTASSATASLSTVLFAYNAYLADLYYSSGTVYDLLCFACLAGAVLLYSAKRSKGRPGATLLAAIVALQIFGLNAKEMAAVLPVLLAGYELLFRPRAGRDFRAAVITAAIVSIGMYGRLFEVGGMAVNPAYRPSLDQAQDVLRVYVGLMFYNPPSASGAFVVSFVSALVLSVFPARRNHIRFAALWALITPLPVLLISQRSLYVMYVPMLGVAMLAGSVLAAVLPARLKDGRSVLILPLACAALLLPLHLRHRPEGLRGVTPDEPKVRSIVALLDRQLPAMPKGARVYVDEDPFANDDWILTMLFRLYYRDDTLVVDRRKQNSPGPAGHHYVLSLRDGPWSLSVTSGGGSR
jgi:hypothetical protein